MKMIDGIFVAVISALALALGACGNYRIYVGGERYDTVQEHRVTHDKSWWEAIAGGQGGKPLSGE